MQAELLYNGVLVIVPILTIILYLKIWFDEKYISKIKCIIAIGIIICWILFWMYGPSYLENASVSEVINNYYKELNVHEYSSALDYTIYTFLNEDVRENKTNDLSFWFEGLEGQNSENYMISSAINITYPSNLSSLQRENIETSIHGIEVLINKNVSKYCLITYEQAKKTINQPFHSYQTNTDLMLKIGFNWYLADMPTM